MKQKVRVSRRWVIPAIIISVVVVATGAGAAAAFETDTVESYWGGLWWAISLITTVGFVGAPPKTAAGEVASVILMLSGFALLSLLSAALASLFVREDEEPRERRSHLDIEVLHEALRAIDERLDRLERRIPATEPAAPLPGTDDLDPPDTHA